jgi:thioredoxin-related protein
MSNILLFTATGCDYCDKMRDNIIDSGITVPVQEIDNDSNPDLVRKYGIQILPTLILINEQGQHRLNGLQTTTKIKEWVNGKEKA